MAKLNVPSETQCVFKDFLPSFVTSMPSTSPVAYVVATLIR